MKLTNNDRFRAFIEAGVDGGWKPRKGTPLTWYEYSEECEGVEPFIIKPHVTASKGDSTSLPDLLADSRFMGAVNWKAECGLYNNPCMGDICSASRDKIKCLYKAPIYHSLEAVKLLHTKTADDAVRYLYEQLEGK